MFMQLKVLVLTSKKPTFKLSAYTFEYGPLLPYIHFVSTFVPTHMMNAPRSSHFSLLFTSVIANGRQEACAIHMLLLLTESNTIQYICWKRDLVTIEHFLCSAKSAVSIQEYAHAEYVSPAPLLKTSWKFKCCCKLQILASAHYIAYQYLGMSSSALGQQCNIDSPIILSSQFLSKFTLFAHDPSTFVLRPCTVFSECKGLVLRLLGGIKQQMLIPTITYVNQSWLITLAHNSHCVLYYIPVCLMQCRKLTAALLPRYVHALYEVIIPPSKNIGRWGERLAWRKCFNDLSAHPRFTDLKIVKMLQKSGEGY